MYHTGHAVMQCSGLIDRQVSIDHSQCCPVITVTCPCCQLDPSNRSQEKGRCQQQKHIIPTCDIGLKINIEQREHSGDVIETWKWILGIVIADELTDKGNYGKS